MISKHFISIDIPGGLLMNNNFSNPCYDVTKDMYKTLSAKTE